MYPPSFNNLTKESDKEFIKALGIANAEVESRLTRKTKVEIYDYQPSDINAETHLAWSGTVGLIIAPKGAAILDRIRKAVTTNNGDDLVIANEMKNAVVGRTPISYEEAVQGLTQQNVFASLRYKGKALISGAFVPSGLQAYASGIPYNGGPLDPNGFELVEHYIHDAPAEFEAILLKRAPRLTEAEQFALNELNDDILSLGMVAMCFAISAVTVTYTVSVATGMTCPHSSDYKRGLKNPELDEAIMKNANPELIARQLLKARREIIEGIIS